MSSLPVVIERKSPTHRVLQLVGVLAVFGFYFYVVNVVAELQCHSLGDRGHACRSRSSD